jgi:hypothetical protein
MKMDELLLLRPPFFIPDAFEEKHLVSAVAVLPYLLPFRLNGIYDREGGI